MEKYKGKGNGKGKKLYNLEAWALGLHVVRSERSSQNLEELHIYVPLLLIFMLSVVFTMDILTGQSPNL
jgi:hypothetical protein